MKRGQAPVNGHSGGSKRKKNAEGLDLQGEIVKKKGVKPEVAVVRTADWNRNSYEGRFHHSAAVEELKKW